MARNTANQNIFENIDDSNDVASSKLDAGADSLDELNSDLDSLFGALDDAFPDVEELANFHTDLVAAQTALANGDDNATNLFANIRRQWKEAVDNVDIIIDEVLSNAQYDVYTQAPNVDGVLQANGVYSPVQLDSEPVVTTTAPDLPIPITSTVVDNRTNTNGNTVVTFIQYSAYRNALLTELDAILDRITVVKNTEASDTNYVMNKLVRQQLENAATGKGFSKKILSVAQYATKLGYDSLSAEQIFELDQAIFRESKILGYTRVKKIAQQIINHLSQNIKETEDSVEELYTEITDRLKTSSQKEKLFGISFTGNSEDYCVVFGYTYSEIIKREPESFRDEQFRNIGDDIKDVFVKYKQELIQINAYEANTNFGPDLPYASSVVYTTTSFTPHTMYNPTTGEAVFTETYEDHLRYSALGYVHTKPNVTTGETESSVTTSTSSAGTSTSTTTTTSTTYTPPSSTSYSSGY
tara:strand:- start:321 stop:1727 length:1407 start_codon:yes stop_codon:yes gene_type:complete